MKAIIVGDVHIGGLRPENRKDNFFETVLRKVGFIWKTAAANEATAILSPGDWTNTPSLSWFEYYSILEISQQYPGINLYCTFGQHDMRYRTKYNTALMAMGKTAGNIVLLDNISATIPPNIFIAGCSYGSEPIDPPEDESIFKILLIHKMIIQEKLWNKQQDYEAANLFLRRSKYDLIVSGDNHQSFEASTLAGKLLFNCGALIRNKINMADHKPYIVIFDTETGEYSKIYVPIDPPEEVFRLEKVDQERSRDEKLDAFVKGLSETKEMDLDFEDRLRIRIKEDNIDPETASIILESLKERKKEDK